MSADELVPQAPPSTAGGGRAEVEALIPHRDPFLFVDEVVAREPDPLPAPDAAEGARLTARWTIAADRDFYRGHYPGEPVTPGVILCEHAFQTGALLVASSMGGFVAEDGVPVLTRVGGAKFKRIVEPGETVETTVEVTQRVGPAWYMRATVRVGGAVCVRLEPERAVIAQDAQQHSAVPAILGAVPAMST